MMKFSFLIALLTLTFGTLIGQGQGCLMYGGSTFVQDNGDGTCTYNISLTLNSGNAALGIATFYLNGATVHTENDCVCNPSSITFPITTACSSEQSISVLFNAPGQEDDCFGRTGFVVLPVEWLGFDISATDDAITMNWATASEVNNNYFEVQRSYDARSWITISDKIDAAQHSDRDNSYKYTDNEPLLGYNYYRVQQTDFDGRSSSTNTLSYFYEDGSTIDVFPNPVEDVLFVKSTVLNNWSIFNLQGVLIKTGSESNINTSDINSGSYIIRINTKTKSKSVNFFKL